MFSFRLHHIKYLSVCPSVPVLVCLRYEETANVFLLDMIEGAGCVCGVGGVGGKGGCDNGYLSLPTLSFDCCTVVQHQCNFNVLNFILHVCLRLGMSHDSDGNNCQNGKNIMASWSASGPESLKWSSCSAAVLKDFLRFGIYLTVKAVYYGVKDVIRPFS